jgi:hypothetical protein
MYSIRIEGFQDISDTSLDLTLNIPILPEPQTIDYSHSFKRCLPEFRFSVHGLQNISKLEYHIKENFGSANRELTIEKYEASDHSPKSGSCPFSDFRKNEFYTINFVDGGYVIEAESEKGLFYGLVSLSQLIFRVVLGQESFDAIEVVSITDYPHFELRGASEQVCHGQVPNLDSLKTWIKYMSRYKSNMLIINLEDIMGFDEYPEIAKARGSLTKSEISELSEFADLYYCELVPGFQCLGHLENFLVRPEFREYAEFPGANSLDISNPKTYQLLEYFYREICTVFKSRYVHIEMDEAYDFGLYNSRELVKKEGRGKVLLNHILKIHDLITKQLGKTLIMYHDSLQTESRIIKDLPKDIIVIYWNYNLYPSDLVLSPFKKNGIRTVVSPSIINWTRPFPYLKHGFKNMQAMVEIGKTARCHGFINSAWGDFSNENFIPLNIIPLSFGCYLAWNPNINRSAPKKKLTTGATINRYKWAFSRDFFKYDYFNAIWDLMENISAFNEGGPWDNNFFIELWTHPFDGFPRGDAKSAKKRLKKVALAREYFELLLPNIRVNSRIMAYLKYCIDVIEFQAEKIVFSHYLHKRWRKPDFFISKSELPQTEYLLEKLRVLRGQYSELWNECAKPQGLERILHNFDNLESWLTDIKSAIVNKRVFKIPILESEWIGPAEPNNQQPVVFRKTFTIPENRYAQMSKAMVQGIANTYLRIKVNGTEVGEVISRFFLSPVVYDSCVKTFDIKDLIKPGKNIIEVISQEFTFSINAFNILIEVFFESLDAKYVFPSNSSWSYLPVSLSSDKDSKWKVPKIYGKPPKLNGLIYKPNLLLNKKSVITREFGQLGYIHSMILNLTKSKRLSRWAASVVKKRRSW